jgi:hypothetical protein
MLPAVLPPSEFGIILKLKDRGEGINLPVQVRNKPPQIIYLAEKLLHFDLTGRRSHIPNRFDSVMVYLYTMFMYDKS